MSVWLHFCRSETRLSRSWQCRCRSMCPTSMWRLLVDGPLWSTTLRWSSPSSMTQSYGEQVHVVSSPDPKPMDKLRHNLCCITCCHHLNVAADFDWLLMNVSLLQAFRQTACCQLDYRSFGSSLEMTDDWWLSSKPMPSSEVCVFSYLFSFHCICKHNLPPNCIWTQLDI